MTAAITMPESLRHVGRPYVTTLFVRDGALLYVTDGAAIIAMPDRWPEVEHDPWSQADTCRRSAPAIMDAVRSACLPARALPAASMRDSLLALRAPCGCGGWRVTCYACDGDGEIGDDADRDQCGECDGIGTVECMVPGCVNGWTWPERHAMVGIDLDPALVSSVLTALVDLGVTRVRMSRVNVLGCGDALALASVDGSVAACVMSMTEQTS